MHLHLHLLLHLLQVHIFMHLLLYSKCTYFYMFNDFIYKLMIPNLAILHIICTFICTYFCTYFRCIFSCTYFYTVNAPTFQLIFICLHVQCSTPLSITLLTFLLLLYVYFSPFICSLPICHCQIGYLSLLYIR